MNKTTHAVFSQFVPDFNKLVEVIGINSEQLERVEWGKGDVNSIVPRRNYHDGSLGVSELDETVYVYREGNWIALNVQREESFGSNYAYTQSSHDEGQPIGDLLQRGDKFVVIDRFERDDWPGRELTRERSLVLWEIGSILTEEDRLVQWAVEILASRDLSKYFTAAGDVQREFDLSESAVRKACSDKRVRCWQLGRDWIVYRRDAEARWAKK